MKTALVLGGVVGLCWVPITSFLSLTFFFVIFSAVVGDCLPLVC